MSKNINLKSKSNSQSRLTPKTETKKSIKRFLDNSNNKLETHLNFSDVKRKGLSNSKNKIIAENNDIIRKSVNLLFQKFIKFYSYEPVFLNYSILDSNLDNNIDYNKNQNISKEKNFKLEKDLNKLFSRFKVVKTKDNLLNSFGDVGSFLLSFSEIWIMHIKTLIEKSNKVFDKILIIFYKALEHENNAKMLFDYFIEIISKELDQNSVTKSIKENKLPDKFIQIFEENQNKIIEKLGYSIDIDSLNNSSNDSKRFTFNEIKNREDLSENKLLFNDSKNNINLGKENYKDDEEDDLINNLDNNLENKSFLSLSENELKDVLSDFSNDKTIKTSNSQIINSNLNLDKNFKKRKDFRRKKINLEEIIEEASITHSDFRKSGNFAIFEVTSQAKSKINSNFILTPLKKSFSTFSEKKIVKEDLEEAKKNFIDFIYQPYDESLFKRIKEAKKLNF